MNVKISTPLMTKSNNSKENENMNSQKNEENENESVNLLDNNNVKENINKDIKNDIRNNLHSIDFHKKSLIFLSYAIQILIYFILLEIYFDKNDYIKKL